MKHLTPMYLVDIRISQVRWDNDEKQYVEGSTDHEWTSVVAAVPSRRKADDIYQEIQDHLPELSDANQKTTQMYLDTLVGGES